MAKLSQRTPIATPPASAERLAQSEVDQSPSPKLRATLTRDVTESWQGLDDSQSMIQSTSDVEEDARSVTLPAEAPPPVEEDTDDKDAGRPQKRQRRTRRPRMLKGLNAEDILTPQARQQDTSLPRGVTLGLKTPNVDQSATRRSGRTAAQKPVLYNIKIHPQDYALPFRRGAVPPEKDQETDNESVYQSAAEDAEDDVKAAVSDDEDFTTIDYAEQVLSRGLKVPTPDSKATRRSARGAAKAAVNYNLKVHPNDADIGWPSRRAIVRKRSTIDPQPQGAEEALKESERNDTAHASKQVSPAAQQHTRDQPLQSIESDDQNGDLDVQLNDDLPASSQHTRSLTLDTIEGNYFDKERSPELGGFSSIAGPEWDAEAALRAAILATQPSGPPLLSPKRHQAVFPLPDDTSLLEDWPDVSERELSQLFTTRSSPQTTTAAGKENQMKHGWRPA